MAPQVNIFEPYETSMKLSGEFPSSSNVPTCVAVFLRSLTLCSSLLYVSSMFVQITFGEGDYMSKVEILTNLLVNSNLMYRRILLVLMRKELAAHKEKINALLNEIESIYGMEIVQSWQEQCKKILYFNGILLMGVIILPSFLLPYYKHYVEGINDATPFEGYNPFNRATQFHLMIIFQSLVVYSPASNFVITNTFIGTISVAVVGILGKISDQYSQLSPSNINRTFKPTVHWHSEVIQIVEGFNSFFGSAIMLDYFLTIVFLCIGTCLTFTAQKDGHDGKFFIYTCGMCALFALSLTSYLCGHKVSLASEKVVRTICQNEWYLLTPAQRKELIIPIALANKEQSFNYRKCIHLNLGTYLVIVRHSYSFLALLNLIYK